MANDPEFPNDNLEPAEGTIHPDGAPHEPDISARHVKLAINPNMIDKNAGGDEKHFAIGWQDVELTLSEFIGYISAGVGYCSQLNGRRRKSENFHAADIVSVDIDDGVTVEEALELSIVRDHAAFIYTTASHRRDAPRFRVVFILPQTIIIGEEIRAVSRSLSLRIGGDLSATDPCRIYYGNQGATVHFVGKTLSIDLVDELTKQSASLPSRAMPGVSFRSQLAIPPNTLIRTDGGTWTPFSYLTRGTRVCCPFHDDKVPSAFVVVSSRDQTGIHCSKCNSTYWPTDPGEFDFSDFETVARSAAAGIAGSSFQDTLVTIGTSNATPDRLFNPMTYVKAPKGTGKTTGLVNLSGARNDKVLLIGHRRLLSRQSASRLGLTTYLDCDIRSWKGDQDRRLDRFAVSVDKIEMVPSSRKYKLVMIDESEQVLAHFLSDTISADDGRNREDLFARFGNLLRRADHVIALDADLGWLSYYTLTQLKFGVDGRDPWGPVTAFHEFRTEPPEHTLEPFFIGDTQPTIEFYKSRVIINERRPGEGKQMDVYDSERHLIGDLIAALRDKKRCVVVSNSKKELEALDKYIAQAEFDARVLLATSGTSDNKAVKDFIQNPVGEIDNYDVILASPTMGTGVDITFPSDEERVDFVYGFCHANVNSHLDFDQQLSRVRHPKAVKVWISAQTYAYETSQDVVKEEILLGGQLGARIRGFEEDDGKPIYRRDLFLEMAALSVSQKRASMNKLKANFVRHKQDQGFRILNIKKDDHQAELGKTVQKIGSSLLDAEFVERMLAAPAVKKLAFEDLTRTQEIGETISREESWSLDKTRLELFYRQAISRELISLDNRGKFREKVQLYQKLIASRALNDPRQPLAARDRFLRDPERRVVALAQLLEPTPIFGQDGFRPNIEIRISDLSSFANLAVGEKAALENQLGLEIRGDVARNPVQQLNRVLALIGQELAMSRVEKRGGQKTRHYSLKAEPLNRMKSLVERRQDVSAWEELYKIHNWGRGADGADE